MLDNAALSGVRSAVDRGAERTSGCTDTPDDVHFDEIFSAHGGAVFSMASTIVGHERAKDVAQETFLRFWKQPDRYDPTRGNIRTLLVSMAHNIAIDMSRSEHARNQREFRNHHRLAVHHDTRDDFAEIDDEVARQQTIQRLYEALGVLSAEQRQAILTIAYGNCTYRHAAGVLGLPEGTFKTRVRDGMQRLRHTMQPEAGAARRPSATGGQPFG